MQKILPGVNPLKALQTLPGVSFQTADPWGNNEQNLSLFIHGFNGQQLGYTMDGVPLGDQQYGNYNGLSPQRAVISENVGSVILSSGAGDLGPPRPATWAAPSRPSPAIRAPQPGRAADRRQLQDLAHLRALRHRHFGGQQRLYIAGVHHEAKAWDFDGRQGGDQINAKYVNQSSLGKLTCSCRLLGQDRAERRQHRALGRRQALSTSPTPARSCIRTSSRAGLPGRHRRHACGRGRQLPQLLQRCPAHRLPDLRQVRHANLAKRPPGRTRSTTTTTTASAWSPVRSAWPACRRCSTVYFPGQNLKQVFGNSGYATRTTEYRSTAWAGCRP
jgi:iron complex outermembrane receptor protein